MCRVLDRNQRTVCIALSFVHTTSKASIIERRLSSLVHDRCAYSCKSVDHASCSVSKSTTSQTPNECQGQPMDLYESDPRPSVSKSCTQIPGTNKHRPRLDVGIFNSLGSHHHHAQMRDVVILALTANSV
jgi:hypothetical protein